MRRRRPLVRRARDALRERAGRLQPADRAEPGRAVPDCACARQRGSGGFDAGQGGGAVRSRPAVRQRGEHGEAARCRRVVGGGQRRGPDAWRLRLRRGLRHRAEVPRDAPLSGRADLDQPDSRLRRRARARAAEVVLRPLAGITVVAVEQAVAAPFATRQLADLGARVIKIERPDGGDFARHYDTTVNGLSSYFVWLNRSKQSITLDVKRSEGARVLAQLVERADVFVQNL